MTSRGTQSARISRRVSLGAVLVVMLCTVGVAVAYWARGGTGTGSASATTNPAPTVHQTSPSITTPHPGTAAQNRRGNLDNSTAGKAHLHSVTASAHPSSSQADRSQPVCIPADLSSGGSATVDAEVLAGNRSGSCGTRFAGVGTLAAPTGVTATSAAGSSTASVGWTGVTGPGGGAVDGYYVQRLSGGLPSPACSSSPDSLLAPGTSGCDDTDTPDGTYTYTVTAVLGSSTADSAPSAAISIDALSHFEITAPASTTAGASFTVAVTAQDQANNTITGYVGTAHFATSDLNGAVLPADYTFVAGDDGAHTFANGVTLNTSPSQSVTVNDVADPTVTGTVSVAVSPGAPAQLGFSQQPGGGTGGTAWTTQPKLAIQDAQGNTITTSTAPVTLAITPGSGTPGALLTCTANPKAAAAGIATFAGCKINLAGSGYTLTATSPGLSNALSSSFDVAVGPASKLVYTQGPSAVTAGQTISPAVTLSVQDAGGNLASTSNATVTMAISTNPGGGTLSGTTSINAVNGIVTFSNLSINRSANGYKLTASSTGLTSAASAAFNVSPGAPAQLGFSQQPGGGTGGTAWTTQPKLAIQDAQGNTITTSTAPVTLAITPGSGTPGALLTCTANPKAAAAGIATFAGCKINLAGSGYTLTATSPGLSNALSSSFDVAVGPASKLVYTQGPSAVTAGQTISPAVTLSVQDAGGNLASTSNATVTMAISTNPGGGTLSGTTSINAVNGIVTFSNLSINRSANGYKLTASSTGLTSAASAAFNVSPGAPAQLGFSQQPGGGTGGTAWTTQPKLAIQDAQGNTITTSTAPVTLAITPGSGTPGALLTCTANPKAAAAGIATFAGCKINLAGSGYTLTATSPGLSNALSSSFDVAVGPASKLVYTQGPSAVTAGQTISPAVTLSVQDAGGNLASTSNATVTMAISTNPGGGTLSGTTSINAVNGIVTFSNLSINRSANGYKLTASSTGLTSAASAAFNVSPGAPAQLGFSQQPGGGTGGTAWTTQPKLAIQDAQGNTITTSTAPVTLAITPGSGTPGALLTCTANPKAAAAGIATFAGCKINLAGSGYTLTATSPGLSNALSSSFDVAVGPASKLVYTQGPSAVTAGQTISPAVTLSVQDAGGNLASTSNATVTMAISTNPGGGTLSGTTSINAVNGIVTFSNLSINRSANGYKLTASSTGLTSAASAAFNVSPGAPAQLGFSQQPGGGTGGTAWTTQPKLAIQDAQGNTITTSTAPVTLAITPGSGTPGALLTCTANPKAAAAGIATFAGCKINLAGSGYTLTATSPGLTSLISNLFNVS